MACVQGKHFFFVCKSIQIVFVKLLGRYYEAGSILSKVIAY